MDIKINNISFKSKYPTIKVLEVTTQKIFDSDGVSGYISTLKELHGNVPRYTGHQGFKKYAEEVTLKIFDKYPNIKKASEDIINILDANKHIFKADERKKLVEPILKRFNKKIDIEI